MQNIKLLFRLPALIGVIALAPLVMIAQTYNDGPIELQVKVREINTQVSATDASVFGIGFSPDEMTYHVWARDNADVDGVGWTGGQCLQQNFDPPGVSTDFNTTIFSFIYPGATVPQFFDIRMDNYEDDADSDFLCGGSRCNYNPSTCCGVVVFGACVGVTTGDDNRCDANPYRTQLDYRLGPPCQWYSHGYVTGSCSGYLPRIESYWRYTRGTSCSNTINLGTLPSGGSLTHFNSNECYSNNFAASSGKDVYYEFTTTTVTGVVISLCGAGTAFNTVLYLLDNACNQIAVNDNFCGNVSQITTNLCTPGTYKVVVDGATAAAQGIFTLTITDDPSALMSVSVVATDVSCNGGNNGSVLATVTSGSAPFTYTWSPNLGNTALLTGLGVGTYSVTVTDATGCTATGSATVSQPPVLTFTTSVTPPVCNGGNDGSIAVTATGGTPPYQYSSDGGNIFQNNNILTGLGAGTYTVVVKDANNCLAQNAVTISAPAAIQPNLTVTNISCNGANDGAVTANPTNGTPPYEYSLDSGPFLTTNSFTGLSTGFHLLTVRDANGCTASAGFNIFEPSVLGSIVQSVTNVRCNGGSDGSFSVTGTGGVMPYTYSIDGTNYQSSGNFTGLTAGIYNIYVRDSNNCQTLNTVTIGEPAPLVPSVLFQINISCIGRTDGVVVLTASGGTAPYYFSKNGINYVQSGFFDRLPGGNYTYYVRDDNNCEDSITFTIFEPDSLKIDVVSTTDATCLGISDGSITLSGSGGTPPYSFSYNGGPFQSSPTFNGLTAGDFPFTIRDDKFCETTDSFTIGFTTTVLLQVLNQVNVACNGDSSGSITVAASNGTPPYQYSLDGVNFQNSGTFNNLPVGNYTVTARDAIGCLALQQVSITQAPPLNITLIRTVPASCFNSQDGLVEVNVTGGTAPYSFLWSNNRTTQNLINVGGGTYTLTVTDGNNCTATFSATVGQSPVMFIGLESIHHVSCFGANDGSVNVNVTGGTPGYVYNWSNFTQNEDLVGVGPGTYSITAVDANNCSISDTFVITSPLELTASLVGTTDVTCAGGNNGSITVSAAGGVAPLQYSINGIIFQNDSTFNGLRAGDYAIVVRDANGCQTAVSASINQGDEFFLSYGGDVEIIKGMTVPLKPILIPPGVVIDSVHWSPADGLSCTNCLEPSANPQETTVYTVTVIDNNGCSASAVVRVVVREEYQIFIPNIFTPNNDGVNDRFSFHAYGTKNIEVRIFNRWGAEVYYNPNQQPNDEREGWDGTYNGKEAQQGAYVYMIKVLFTNNEERTKTGTITVMR
ncbi:MAG: hypothetical protein KatS3mg031_1299 [Chitinophagales bacterium]|nr:MAG: hypothetical protein KatS3mg031_1299 [Chitinophagales bacterium]